jgi:Tol biopolymer transport system component
VGRLSSRTRPQALPKPVFFSPDGTWIAYQSDKTGRYEIYVRPFRGPGGDSRVSIDGGTQVRWNSNGKELFYRDGDALMVVDVSGSVDLALSQPRALFHQHYAFGSNISIANFDVAPDGQQFVMVKESPGSSHLNLVLNWFDELNARVPNGGKR